MVNLKEGEIPFFGRQQTGNSLPTMESLDQYLYLFNGSSFTLAVILTSSVLVRESSSLHLGAFHSWLTEYSSVRSVSSSDLVTMMPNQQQQLDFRVCISSSMSIRYIYFPLIFPVGLPDRICLKFYAKLVYHSGFQFPHSRIFPAYPPSLRSVRYSSSSLTAPPCCTDHLHIIFKLKFYCHENFRKKLHWKRKTSCRITDC